jgi:O-antigen/teichoic acid export membrane protein
MSSKKIATSTFWQLGSQMITMLLGIISIKFVTTALSQSLVGNYQTVYSYLQIFGILADFGLYAVAVRELSKSAQPHVTLGSLVVLRALITFLSLGSAFAIAWIIPSFHGTPLPLGITIALFVPFFVLLSGMIRTVFQVHYKMHAIFMAEVCSKFVPVCLIGLAVLLGARESQNLSLYYLFLAFGGLGSLTLFFLSVLFVWGLLSVRPAFSWNEFCRLARLALPFGLAFLFTTIYRQSDVTLIAFLRPHDYDIQNAYYGTVLRLAEVGFLLPTFLLNSALPMMSGTEKNEHQLAHFRGQVLLSLLVLGSLVSLFSYFWARPIILLVTRESYLSTAYSFGADTALELLSLSIFLSFLVSFFFYLLLSVHAWKPLLLSTFIAALFSVFINLSFIPLMGFVGAGITSILTHIILAILLTLSALSRVKVCLRFAPYVRWFVFSLLMACLLFATRLSLSGSLRTLIAGLLVLGVSGVLAFLLGLIRNPYCIEKSRCSAKFRS